AKRLFFMFLFQSPSIFPLNRFNVCLQMGWNGAILGGILGGRRGVGESFAGFLPQGSILRVKGWTNELFFCPKGCVLKKNHSLLKVFAS
ncbi:MAG: hypothetical protein SO255_07710, partial [Sodaliphilus sp.]|nr:hypothetical protein [Sodaliphilus sp.]